MVRLRRLLASAPPEHSVPLRLWTMVAVLVSVFAVTAHDDFLQQRLTIPLLVVAGFAFSYWRRGKRNWWVKVILAVLCLEVSRQFLRGVIADPYHTSVPLTVLLLWLQTLHAFDVPARRDLLFSLLSSVILMAVAAAFALDHSFLLYLALFAFAAVQAMVHNAWQGVSEYAARLPGPRRPAPRAAAGAAVPAPAAVAAPRTALLWAANHLLVLVLLGAALVFAFTPRLEGMRLTSLPFSAQRVLLDVFAGRIVNPAYPEGPRGPDGGPPPWNPRGYFGFSTTLDLRMRGVLDDRLVMRVRATRAYNWRGMVFDTYTGTGWEIAEGRLTQIDGGVPPMTITRRQDESIGYTARHERVVQTFFIEEEQPNVVFAAPLAELLYLAADRVYVDRYGAIRLPGTLRAGDVYSVVSRAWVPQAAQLRAARGPVPEFIAERYLQLPPLPERVLALARRLTEGQPTQFDQVVAVNRFLITAYRYDLSIPHQRRPGDAVDYFLFVERRGYCEQFASAMTVLLRAAGIPARLVTGYTPGTLNPITGLLEVRNSDAHAWVEVFFPGLGWVEFEPTPGFPDTAELGAPASRRWVWQDLLAFGRTYARDVAARWPAAARVLDGLLLAAWAGLAVALALGGGLAVAGARRSLAARATPKEPAAILAEVYREMCALLARRGLSRAPSETVAEFRMRVEAAEPSPEVAAISAAVERVAYAGEVVTPAVVAAARAHLDRFRRRAGPVRGAAR
ncbi:MAG: transglutaminaseTgpA domain-containing protein [Armatimonadota bacterium]|nr:transglutaminaseTgpA domain-containing protein [Armatimonadota bacterium]